MEHRGQGAHLPAGPLEQDIKMLSTGNALKFKNINILLFKCKYLNYLNIFRKLKYLVYQEYFFTSFVYFIQLYQVNKDLLRKYGRT